MSCEIDAKPFGSSAEPIPQALGQIGSTNSVFKISQRSINMDSVAQDLPPVSPASKKSPLYRSTAIQGGHPITLSPISPSDIGRTVCESPTSQGPKKTSPTDSGSKLKQKLGKSISDSSSYVSPKAAHPVFDKATSDSGTFAHKPTHPGDDKIKLYQQHHQNLVQRVRSLSDEAVGPEVEPEGTTGGRGAPMSPLSNDGHPLDNVVHLAALSERELHDHSHGPRQRGLLHGHHSHRHGVHDSSHHSLSSASSQSSIGSAGPPVSQGAAGFGLRVHALEPLVIPEHSQTRELSRHHHGSHHYGGGSSSTNHSSGHYKVTPPRELEKLSSVNRFNPDPPCSKGLLDKMNGTAAADRNHLAQIHRDSHYYDEKRDDFQVHYRHPVDLVKKDYYSHNVVYEDDEIDEGEHFYY